MAQCCHGVYRVKLSWLVNFFLLLYDASALRAKLRVLSWALWATQSWLVYRFSRRTELPSPVGLEHLNVNAGFIYTLLRYPAASSQGSFHSQVFVRSGTRQEQRVWEPFSPSPHKAAWLSADGVSERSKKNGIIFSRERVTRYLFFPPNLASEVPWSVASAFFNQTLLAAGRAVINFH